MIEQSPAVSRVRLRAHFALAGAWAALCVAGTLAQTAPADSRKTASDPPAQSAATGDALPASQANPGAAWLPTGSITEDELKRLLVGKPMFLRGGYLDDSLNFNEHGSLVGNSPRASYTLCAVRIDKVRLTKHRVELVGARYGLHFLGALPYEDPTKAVDRVRVTPKKKALRITIDRELVVKPKKTKTAKQGEKGAESPAGDAATSTETPAADEAKTAAPSPEESPADPNSVTRTTSPAHAARMLDEALDRVFAERVDERMIAAMPDFWKLYYRAAASKTDYRPSDPAVMRQDTVDRKARLLTTFEPGSNQYAQDNGVAGMSLYHVVIGADGKPLEIAVARPIGFGLDESAVDAIRQAKFEPALKDGKAVPVLLDLVVQFRIYSKRTAAERTPSTANRGQESVLPGPYSVAHP